MKEFILLFSEANGPDSLAILNAESVEQAIWTVARFAEHDCRSVQVWDRETLKLVHVSRGSAARGGAFSVSNLKPVGEADRFGVTCIDPLAV
jgi:hypothetical protein